MHFYAKTADVCYDSCTSHTHVAGGIPIFRSFCVTRLFTVLTDCKNTAN